MKVERQEWTVEEAPLNEMTLDEVLKLKWAPPKEGIRVAVRKVPGGFVALCEAISEYNHYPIGKLLRALVIHGLAILKNSPLYKEYSSLRHELLEKALSVPPLLMELEYPSYLRFPEEKESYLEITVDEETLGALSDLAIKLGVGKGKAAIVCALYSLSTADGGRFKEEWLQKNLSKIRDVMVEGVDKMRRIKEKYECSPIGS